MEQIRANGEQKELRDEIVDLGTRYGIVTPYTSYLALENNVPAQNVVTGRRNERRLGVGGQATSSAPAAPTTATDARASTGIAAVQQSKRVREQQEAERFDKDALSSAIRTAGGKTFYLRDGVWIDAEFKAEARLPETTIKFGSDEYFTLLNQKRRLAEFFALGERVIVVFEGRVYRVTAGQ
jgi:Ca-activated chloride channel family protein